MALYDAKADGRGTYRFFEPEMNTRMKVRRELEMDLRKALATEQFELHYQPLVDPADQGVNAFEALLRWNHPTRGLISPADFIPIAEETGLIVPLGEWVLKAACAEAVEWPEHIKVAVNLSPAQFNNRNLVTWSRRRSINRGLSPHRLQLEITETVLLQNTLTTLARCTSCASWACRSHWTTSAPAIPRSAICAASRSTRSRSTARSSRTCQTAPSRSRSCMRWPASRNA